LKGEILGESGGHEYLKDILRKIEVMRLGLAEPKELERLAVDNIAKCL